MSAITTLVTIQNKKRAQPSHPPVQRHAASNTPIVYMSRSNRASDRPDMHWWDALVSHRVDHARRIVDALLADPTLPRQAITGALRLEAQAAAIFGTQAERAGLAAQVDRIESMECAA